MGRNVLYREVGEAVHVAQTLELNIGALITIMNGHYGARMDASTVVVGDDKRTLGQLIHELQKRASLDQAGAQALAEALEARNYVAHQFFIRNIDAFESEAAYARALVSLKARAKQIAIGSAITSVFVQGFCKALGIEQSDVLIRQDI